MKLEKRLHEDVYYYTEVFDDPRKLLDIVEELENESSTYPAISE
jgi:cephalosporin-C deacetylase-like acetyl esterase